MINKVQNSKVAPILKQDAVNPHGFLAEDARNLRMGADNRTFSKKVFIETYGWEMDALQDDNGKDCRGVKSDFSAVYLILALTFLHYGA